MNLGFQKYGRSARLSDGKGWVSPQYRAFLQPLRYKNKMYLEGTYTPIGKDQNDLYLYIGPKEHDVTRLGDGARLLDSDAREYVLQRTEKVCRGDTPFYFWAILKAVSGVSV